jgi:membrane protein DedA with SNARE-associated domain
MFDVEAIIGALKTLPPLGVYAALFATTYIENLFPPSPSDVVMLFIATLVGIGTVDLVPTLLMATAGSVTGFLTAFLLGRRFGRSLATSNRFPFLSRSAIEKVEGWFERYGYGVIVANRFLAGTRAVISFFAGMSELRIVKTTLLCTVSALVWNTLVVGMGAYFGENWEKGAELLRQYGVIVMSLIVAVALFLLIRWIYRRKGESS